MNVGTKLNLIVLLNVFKLVPVADDLDSVTVNNCL